MKERKSSPFTKQVEVFDKTKISFGDMVELRTMEGHLAPVETVRRGAIIDIKDDMIVVNYVNTGGTVLRVTVTLKQLNEEDELQRVDMKILFKAGEK